MSDEGILELLTLPRDLRAAAATLGDAEVRYLVGTYYSMQDFRKMTVSQGRAQDDAGEPHATTTFFATQFERLEHQIKGALDVFSRNDQMGAWARQNFGIGPVIAAGLSAHIDIDRAPTVGHIWRYAGLDPTTHWGKGESCPYNRALKTLCWKIGDSFVKFHNHPDCFYGHFYRARKEFELARDASVLEVPGPGWYETTRPVLVDRAGRPDGDLLHVQVETVNVEAVEIADKWFIGGHADAAAKTLTERKIRDKDTRRVYESGRLPAGRLDLRARRYATKLFLSHWHGEAFRQRHGTEPPAPFPIVHLGHVGMIESPVPSNA